jgi:hypothetical protein
MKGAGGFAALSMSNTTIAEAKEVLAQEVPTDPHTRDTYRAIVDAIVPRTPQLEAELGPEHVPGGLDVELEKFLIWDFNHFQEIRLETLRTPVETRAPSAGGGSGGLSEMLPDPGLGGLGGGDGGTTPPDANELVDGLMQPELFQLELDRAGAGSELGALADLAGLDGAEALTGLLDLGSVDADRLGELLDFGATDRLQIGFADAPIPEDAEGIAEFEVLVDAGNETVQQVEQNYPYAAVFPFAFDLIAAEFIARGNNEDAIERDPTEFPGGGTFVQLSRQDRLRCLWEIVDGGAIDRLDSALSPMLPAVGILKYVVMAVNGLHGFGYYTEWSGLGNTKTETPSERVQEVPAGEVQSREQSGYPGPQPGYAADWRRPVHAQTGGRGFADPDAEALDLPQDLTGETIVESVERPAADDGRDRDIGAGASDADGAADGSDSDLPTDDIPTDGVTDGTDGLPTDGVTDGTDDLPTDGVTEGVTEGETGLGDALLDIGGDTA